MTAKIQTNTRAATDNTPAAPDQAPTAAEALASIRETADSGVIMKAAYIKNLATCLKSALDNLSVEEELFDELNTCHCLVECMERYADEIHGGGEQIIDAAISAKEVA